MVCSCSARFIHTITSSCRHLSSNISVILCIVLIIPVVNFKNNAPPMPKTGIGYRYLTNILPYQPNLIGFQSG